MHLYKITVQTLLVLSSLNLVIAAPAPRDSTSGTTQSDGSPPHDTLPLGGSAPSQDSALSSHPLSAASVPATEPQFLVPGGDSMSPSATDRVPPHPDAIAGGSTSGRHTAVTNEVPNENGNLKSYRPTAKTLGKATAVLALAAAGITGAVEFAKWWDKSFADGKCPPEAGCETSVGN